MNMAYQSKCTFAFSYNDSFHGWKAETYLDLKYKGNVLSLKA